MALDSRICGQSVTIPRFASVIVTLETDPNRGDLDMRVFMALAIIITAAVGLGGCFHHQAAVTAAPMPAPPLK